jgi:hypothetical protein
MANDHWPSFSILHWTNPFFTGVQTKSPKRSTQYHRIKPWDVVVSGTAISGATARRSRSLNVPVDRGD